MAEHTLGVTMQYLCSKVKHMYVVDSEQFVFVRPTTITAVYSNVWKGNKRVYKKGIVEYTYR